MTRDKWVHAWLTFAPYLPWILIGIFFIAYTRLAFLNYLRFEVSFDLGSYSQAMYHLSHSHVPYSNMKHQVLWGDHAHFIVALLAPFYHVWPDPRLLLIVQALAATTAGWPIYQIARRLLRSLPLALLMLLNYLSFVGLQYALDFDFHPIVLTGAAIAWALYGLITNRLWLYWLALALGLLTREDAPLIFFMIGVYLLLRRRWRLAALTMIISALYFVLVTYTVMPLWTPTHAALLYADSDKKDLLSLVRPYVLHPYSVLQNMVDTKTKVHTLSMLVQSFGYLPLLSPFTYIASASIIISRFTSSHDYRWLLTNHSNASIAPLLAVGAIFGASHVLFLCQRYAPVRGRHVATALIALCLLVNLYFTSWRDNGVPLREKLNPARNEPAHIVFNRQHALQYLAAMLAPPDVVAVSGGFLAALANRDLLFAFPDGEDKATWLILSSRVDTWPLRPEETKARIFELKQDPRWELVWSGYDVFGFRRLQPPASPPPSVHSSP